MHQLILRNKCIAILKVGVFFLFTVLCLAVIVSQAFAHRVILIAYVEGDTIFVESAFSDGTLCNNADIEVFDPSGKKLLEGRTDENGKFSFKPPRRTDLKLVLDAGMGHRDDYIVRAGELPELVGESPKHQGSSEAVAGMDPEEIESIVDRVIEKRLRPLIQLVAKSQRKTCFSPTEILGGIGYILGLAGIVMYFKSRKGGKS